MEVASGSFVVTLHDDPIYTPGSSDNVQRYDREYRLFESSGPVSRYGVVCRQSEGVLHSCILLAGGGGSRVHDHSAAIVNDACFIGVGDMICSLSLPTLELMWATRADTATCFGVYYCPQHNCLLSHGELEIARLSLSGEIVWSASGRDIFSEGFRIVGDYVEAIDFYKGTYRIDIVTGRCELVQA